MVLSLRAAAAGSIAALTLSACYVVPVAPDGTPVYPAIPSPAAAIVVAPPPAPPVPAVLHARLYPTNDVATQSGVLAGTVTSSMTGKGRFQLDYRGELLVGEATRVPGDSRSGIADAYGERGTYMNCTYRMTTPYQGTGTCKLSNGARYDVHLGS